MKVLDAQATAAKLPYSVLIDRMAGLFAKGQTCPDRHHHTMPMQDEPDATLLLMPAWSKDVGWHCQTKRA